MFIFIHKNTASSYTAEKCSEMSNRTAGILAQVQIELDWTRWPGCKGVGSLKMIYLSMVIALQEKLILP